MSSESSRDLGGFDGGLILRLLFGLLLNLLAGEKSVKKGMLIVEGGVHVELGRQGESRSIDGPVLENTRAGGRTQREVVDTDKALCTG